MFHIIKRELNERMLVTRKLANHVRSLDPEGLPLAATFKGLTFVQLYATYEHVVRGSVQSMLSSISAETPEYRHLKAHVLSLALDARFEATSNCGPRRRWETRIALLEEATSANPASAIPDTAFPSDGSHYRVRQLQTIWRVFGIAEPVVPESKHNGRIEELVENRNAIAHGRSTAEEVGRRYSDPDISDCIDDIDAICLHILTTVHMHYQQQGHRADTPSPAV